MSSLLLPLLFALGGSPDAGPLPLVPGASLPVLSDPKGAGTVDVTVLDWKTLVHRSTNAQGIPSNGLIAVTERGLLLVDTAWTEPETEALLKWGDDRLRRPWIGAVITHNHADRDGGLGALQRRKIPVAALDLTVAKLALRGVQGVTTLFTAGAGTFKDPRGFEAFYPGPGHTSDNIVLSFPTVLYGGCLIKSMVAKDLRLHRRRQPHVLAGGRPPRLREVPQGDHRPRPRPRRPDLRRLPAHAGPAGGGAKEVIRHIRE